MLSSDCSSSTLDLPPAEDREDMSTNLKELAQVYQSFMLFDDAKLLCRKALALETLFLGRYHAQVAITTQMLAGIYYEEGDLGQAALIYKQALAVAERLEAPSDLLIWSILNNLGQCYKGQGLYSEARRVGRQAQRMKNSSLGLQA